VGDLGNFTYKKSRKSNSEIDKTVIDILKESKKQFSVLEFFPWGSDERQYCSPGINLNVGCLTRSMFTQFPEYHTSADNLNFVHSESLYDSFLIYTKIISRLEKNYRKISSIDNQNVMKKSTESDPVFQNLFPYCEPQLGKRGIYHSIGGKNPVNDSIEKERAIMWILAFSDGINSLRDISKKSKIDFNVLKDASDLLLEKKLIKNFDF